MKACSIGVLVAGMMMVNNLRDIENDAAVNKLTIMYYLGREKGAIFYHISMLVAFILALLTAHLYLITLVALLLAFICFIMLFGAISQKDYNKAFGLNMLLAIALTAVLCI
jgi:1,4-dihydroxy-2-naphthoate octaprenyltransferase